MGKLSFSDQYHPMGTCGGLSARPGIVPRLQHRRFTLVIVTAVAGVKQPSANPEYTNPRNEIWLDVR